MREALLTVLGVLIGAGVALAQSGAPVDPTIDLFVTKCASCHSVGKGDRVGPDLANVHTRRDRAWLERFVQTPSSLLDSDADARALLATYKGVRMPDLGLGTDQVRVLVDLIVRCSSEPCELVGKFVAVTEAKPEHVVLGRALFMGTAAISSGAVSCVSCHAVASLGGLPGGTLGKDLTHSFARLGDEGLDAALKSPAFPVMNKVFADRPLDHDEVFALRAFLYEENRTGVVVGGGMSLPLIAVIGSAFSLAALNALWRRRLLGVRATVTARKGSAE